MFLKEVHVKPKALYFFETLNVFLHGKWYFYTYAYAHVYLYTSRLANYQSRQTITLALTQENRTERPTTLGPRTGWWLSVTCTLQSHILQNKFSDDSSYVW